MLQETIVKKLLDRTDIRIGGNRPWDVKINDKRFYTKFLLGLATFSPTVAIGESYMDGWWDCSSIDQAAVKIANMERPFGGFQLGFPQILNLQRIGRAFNIGKRHYDIGNDLFRKMLDRRMVYSCGYWRGGARNLDEAQEAKLDLICRKLHLSKGMNVLDIGCGWGSLLKYASEHYGVRGVGITVSNNQAKLAKKLCRALPIEIKLMDYRDQSLKGKYDAVVSVGMFEHVGPKNYRTFMERARSLLEDKAIFLLHTIGGNKSSGGTDKWIDKYIFPGGVIPSLSQIGKAAEGLFVHEHWENFGPDYDRTLMEWYKNLKNSWNSLSKRYDERFRRMWSFYLLTCAASFRARKNQLWQFVYSKEGMENNYSF